MNFLVITENHTHRTFYEIKNIPLAQEFLHSLLFILNALIKAFLIAQNEFEMPVLSTATGIARLTLSETTDVIFG